MLLPRPQLRFLSHVIEMAAENVQAGRGGPFAALVVRDGEIVASGTNRVTTDNDPTAHAEIVAIREAARRLGTFHLAGCDIYASCEPCPMCLGAIYWARPAAVYFAATSRDAAQAGFDDSFIYEQIGLEAPARRIPMRHVPVEDAGRPFREWLRKPDRTEY